MIVGYRGETTEISTEDWDGALGRLDRVLTLDIELPHRYVLDGNDNRQSDNGWRAFEVGFGCAGNGANTIGRGLVFAAQGVREKPLAGFDRLYTGLGMRACRGSLCGEYRKRLSRRFVVHGLCSSSCETLRGLLFGAHLVLRKGRDSIVQKPVFDCVYGHCSISIRRDEVH